MSRRAGPTARLRIPAGLQDAAEVAKAHGDVARRIAEATEEDVVRLHIPVQQAVRVEALQPSAAVHSNFAQACGESAPRARGHTARRW